MSRTSSMMSQVNVFEKDTWLWHEGGVRTAWDGLRKDVDLWDAAGDCLVYLYAQGTSRRPASFQIPLSAIYAMQCTSLLAPKNDSTPISSASSTAGKQEIFIGAPKHLDREQTFQWHLTTRNFFAWLLRKPLVGAQLGVALSDLVERIKGYRTEQTDSIEQVLFFAEELGYTQLAHRPENAVAMLVFAERQQAKSVWTNAFSHCVGMSELLVEAPDYLALSQVNGALITKVALQMDLELEAKARSVAMLLESDLADESLGLSSSSKDHLDHFRSYLQSHLVVTLGYWPPREEHFPKSIYTALRDDFQCLYEYLGDFSAPSTGDYPTNDFDQQHRYQSLAATRPLLPRMSSNNALRSRSGSFGGLRLRKHTKTPSVAAITSAQVSATNIASSSVLMNPLVEAYANFEEQTAATMHREISVEDARSARWLLIYGMLQTLTAILCSAPEVSEPNEVQYPLCCTVPAAQHRRTASAPTKLFTSPSDRVTPIEEQDGFRYLSRKSSIGNLSTRSTGNRLQLRRLRTMSLQPGATPSRGSRLSRAFTVFSSKHSPVISPIDTNQISLPLSATATSEERAPSPASDVPSLDWSLCSTKSLSSASNSEAENSPIFDRGSVPSAPSSVSDYAESPVAPVHTEIQGKHRVLSSSSSIYSDRGAPAIPAKAAVRADVVDKGLADDTDDIVPGLFLGL